MWYSTKTHYVNINKYNMQKYRNFMCEKSVTHKKGLTEKPIYSQSIILNFGYHNTFIMFLDHSVFACWLLRRQFHIVS